MALSMTTLVLYSKAQFVKAQRDTAMVVNSIMRGQRAQAD